MCERCRNPGVGFLHCPVIAKSSPNFGVNSNEHFMYNNIAKYVLSVCDRYHVVTKAFIAYLRADEPLGWCMSRVPRSGAKLP